MTVTKETAIGDILKSSREAAYILMENGMPCVGCAVALTETLEEACMVHGLDADDLAAQLNDYFDIINEEEKQDGFNFDE
ncbi:MAG: DUF1858 domain-containing protein [Oscillospiraceae bacterium]|jgi:hybrid cluster-associated redox disulfide protein|nr:DUF1858 domain-containing protein [Oscillospiraceae bacterium]